MTEHDDRAVPHESSHGRFGAGELMRTVLRNSVWSTLAVVANPVLQFLFGGLTLRYVGIEATGFSLAVNAVLGIAGRLGTFGIGEAALPAIANSLASGDILRVRRLIGVVLTVFLVSSVLTTAAMVVGAEWFMHWSRMQVDTTTASRFITISCISQSLVLLQQVATTVLRAGGRYELVTMITTPLAFVSGLIACLVLPWYPSLLTVGLLGLASAIIGLLIAVAVTAATIPAFRHPLPGFGELWGLVRYGFWLSLTTICNLLISGIDDLVITGTCGAAAVPPWAIGKRFWLTAHTFLAQHCEHLIPTLGSLKAAEGDSFTRLAGVMHWYLLTLAAVGYALVAWCGDTVVGLIAGHEVGVLCRPAVFAFSLFGMVLALLIIPVTMALAVGASRPMFVVAILSNPAQLAAVTVIATFLGAPAVYYAPVAAIPFLFLATGTTPESLLDPQAIWSRCQPVAIPLTAGLVAIVGSLWIPEDFETWQRVIAAILVAIAVLLSTIGWERILRINEPYHAQVIRVLRYTIDRLTRRVRSLT